MSDGNAELINNTVLGNGSLSNNPGTHYEGNIVMGDRSATNNQNNFNFNRIIGSDSGNGAGTDVTNNYVMGNGAGNGYGNGATNNIAFGTGAGNNINANNTVAMGTNARAAGNSGIAIGDSSFAAGPNDTALGAGATVTADHSTALGAGAVADKENLVAVGTTGDTYRTPGITSQKSKDRQSGSLEVVTSDAGGNLATDGGEIFNRLDENDKRLDNAFRRIGQSDAGVALALAAVNPDLVDGERFGVSANWGTFEGSNAFGMGFQGVLGHDWLAQGDRWAITGGFGVGFVDGNDGDDVWGGRVGGQWTWGHKAVAYATPPLK